MKKIILICCFIFLFISIVTSKYKSYSYSRFRWVDFECAFFKLECIWYNDNLILRNLDSELEMEVILLEDGVIILRYVKSVAMQPCGNSSLLYLLAYMNAC